jgi:tRNA(Ile)-lysidine synthase
MRKGFKNFIEEHTLIQPKSKILLAVSGGVDSMVMLHLFQECGYDFAVAHCNFTLRETESDGDEQLVVDTCKKLNRKLFVKRFSTKDYANENDLSIQVAARNLRYAWFTDICKEFGYQSVAVAHNKNDVAETMLINLSRGTGLKGLTGIKPKTNGIIRPLLFAQRNEIEEYTKSKSISYRVDSSNVDVKYARNRIRHRVLPEFEAINEGIIDNLYSTSLFLAESWVAIDNYNSSFRKDVIKMVDEEVHYSIAKLKDYPFRQVFLVEELTEHGFPASMVLDIEKSLFSQAGRVFFTEKYQLVRDRDSLILSLIKPSKHFVEIKVDEDITNLKEPIPLSFEVVLPDKGFKIPKSKTSAALDYNKLTFPLTIRKWREGDWFMPFGMEGRKKISDFLIDQKVPLHRKNSVLVLESNGHIIWVVGYRIDNRYRISEESEKVLLVKVM